jgi:tetratricopeptide (TPR) repeat protein
MRSALSWAAGRGESEVGLRLAGALWRFWWMRDYFEEGRRWLEEALTRGGGAPAARGKALEGLSWLLVLQGNLDRAETAAEEGLKLSAKAGLESSLEASLRGTLGDVVRSRGEHQRAKELFEESVRLYREIGDRWGVAWTLGGLGNFFYDQEDYERAKELFQEGLTLSRELGGAQPLDVYLSSLGHVYLLEGDYEQSTTLFEEAATLLRERGRRGGLEFAVDNLGWAALLGKDYERAKALHEESLVLCRELGDKLIASESLEGLACAAGGKGDAERAARLFGAAEALREAIGYLQTPRESTLRKPFLEAARAFIEDEAWQEAWREGRKMTFDESVSYALEEDADG